MRTTAHAYLVERTTTEGSASGCGDQTFWITKWLTQISGALPIKTGSGIGCVIECHIVWGLCCPSPSLLPADPVSLAALKIPPKGHSSGDGVYQPPLWCFALCRGLGLLLLLGVGYQRVCLKGCLLDVKAMTGM